MKIRILSAICSILQIIGLVLFSFFKFLPEFPSFILVLIGISGFAGIVRFFLSDAESSLEKALRPFAAVAGFALIIIAIYEAMKITY